jgi:hypothetical protein
MAFRARGERVHAGERETRSTVNLEGLHVGPTPRRVAARATPTHARLVRIAVAILALASDALLATVALIAGSRLVPSREREPGSRVIEPLPGLPRAHFPTHGRVAVAAIDPFGDRVVIGRGRRRDLGFGIFGDGNTRKPGESCGAKKNEES